jgi:hypothetical protein
VGFPEPAVLSGASTEGRAQVFDDQNGREHGGQEESRGSGLPRIDDAEAVGWLEEEPGRQGSA